MSVVDRPPPASRRGRLRLLPTDRRGSVAPTFAIVAVVLFGLMGGATDVILMMQERSKLQSMTDAATLAAARDETDAWKANAEKTFDAMAADTAIAVKTRSFVKDGSKMVGTAEGALPAVFLPILSLSGFDYQARSEVMLPGPGAACIYVVGTDMSETLRVNSGADVTLDCEIHVKTKQNSGAVLNAGIKLATPKVCVEATQVLDNGSPKTANVQTKCQTAADPYAGKLPPEPSTASCTYQGSAKDGPMVTMSPGVYCGDTNFNGSPTVKLEPGLYVFKNGKWNIGNGSITGTDVTFYFADQGSMLHFNSSVTATLKAPSSGTYAGFLLYEKAGLARSQWTFDAGKHELEGVLHMPSRQFTYNSGSKEKSDKLTLVVHSLILNATRWQMTGYGTSGSGAAVPYVAR